jgi:hypothetical protein
MDSGRRLDWQFRSDYIASRSTSYPGDTDVEPPWTDEAFEDVDALVDSPHPSLLGGAVVKKKELQQRVDEEAAASEATRDQPLSARAIRRGQGRSVVYSVRLTPEQTDEIQRIAEDAGVPASSLVRDWVVEGLAAERGAATLDSLVDNLSRDVDKLRRSVARREAS